MLFYLLRNEAPAIFGWIKDLSDKDPTSIFNLFGLIPWDPPGFLIIGIWPILMGLTMYLQQKVKSCSCRSYSSKNFCFLPIILNNNIGSISLRSCCLLDDK